MGELTCPMLFVWLRGERYLSGAGEGTGMEEMCFLQLKFIQLGSTVRNTGHCKYFTAIKKTCALLWCVCEL